MNRPPLGSFRPPRALGNAHVQTIISASTVRGRVLRRRGRAFLASGVPRVLAAGAGVRLSAWQHAAPCTPARGCAILVHGWEGSCDSNDIIETGTLLHALGWDVVRLNLRDHGGSVALNRGIFHSCRIDEVVAAVATIARLDTARPLVVAGFSLGGNFALRIALRAPAAALPLARVVAVCPVVDPAHTLAAMERSVIYERHFLQCWRRSLRAKAQHFPELALDCPGDRRRSLRDLTRVMTERYTAFGTLENYLDGYSLAGARLDALTVHAHVLTARDDPVIPFEDFANLGANPAVELSVSEHGGHCGFIESYDLTGWSARYIADALMQPGIAARAKPAA